MPTQTVGPFTAKARETVWSANTHSSQSTRPHVSGFANITRNNTGETHPSVSKVVDSLGARQVLVGEALDDDPMGRGGWVAWVAWVGVDGRAGDSTRAGTALTSSGSHGARCRAGQQGCRQHPRQTRSRHRCLERRNVAETLRGLVFPRAMQLGANCPGSRRACAHPVLLGGWCCSRTRREDLRLACCPERGAPARRLGCPDGALPGRQPIPIDLTSASRRQEAARCA